MHQSNHSDTAASHQGKW